MTDQTIVLVGCGSSKRDEKAYAFQLYDSDYFCKKMALAVMIGEPAVLSAEHGIIYCDEKIEPYNTHISDLSDRERGEERWALRVAQEIKRREPDRVVCLIPQAYLSVLDENFSLIEEKMDCEILNPFENTTGIGDQMKWLKYAVKEIRNNGTELEEILP